MKKIALFCMAALLAASMLVGCSQSGEMKDGTYRAKFAEPSHDWTEYVEVTVKDGKITNVDFDALNADGDRKSENQEYQEMMTSAGSDIGPMDFYADYNQKLLDAQDASKVDAIAGATNSGINLKTLMSALSGNISSGDTTEVIVPADKAK